MKNKWPVTFAVLLLVASSLACEALSTELRLSNLRMAFDQQGKNVTMTFSPTDVFFAVADLYNAPQGTQLEARWTAVNVTGFEPNVEFQTQTFDITDDEYSGTVYFQLSSAEGWPAGQYRVDVYLNGMLAQTVEFSVQ